MKRMTYFVMALALVLGLSQCKKEQPATPQNGQVRITLNVGNGGNNGSRVNVDPATSPMVTFEKGDQILVGYNGAYVGTLTHNGTQFEGSINATQNGNQPLYFYFVGNKQGTLEAGTTSCTVNISDQTHELPVLSMGESINRSTGETVYYSSETTAYEAQLHNKCALVKFPLANAAGSIKIGGMKNEATINFASTSITPTESTGDVRLYSVSDTEKWAILLPQEAVSNAAVTIGNQSLTVDVPDIEANALLNSISTIGNTSTVIDLSTVTSNTTVEDGAILTGTLGSTRQISIANNATVMLKAVTIDMKTSSYSGITCIGNATIILKNNNTVKGGSSWRGYAGIYVPVNCLLTIDGDGSSTLSATGMTEAAGIGGNSNNKCGNITIKGGAITAVCLGTSGNGAGIGSSYSLSCGNITIANTVTSVTATKGSSNNALYSIGPGYRGTCGTVTIGGVDQGTGVVPIQSDGRTYIYEP